MKLNIDQSIMDFSGKEIQLEGKTLTFRTIIESTLNSHTDHNPLTAEKKLQAFQIGVKLFSKKLDEYTLTIDQVSFIKERVGLFYGPVIYGRFLELIGDETVKDAV
jgi:hypothetical protein